MPARAITATRVREIALSFDGATEVWHMDRPAFRTPRKIFVTMPPGGKQLNLMFDSETQEKYCEKAPDVFQPLPGGWGRMGCTACDIKKVNEEMLRRALATAHQLAKPKPKPSKRKAPG
eukprot:CAMPEP_0177722282 /NCGR_PEP_ID=MMETSP0484_2-20121128/17601_1 /TAXON_ID=354590 /ORGANISM="Rhodomonas lens, Strain RHODO" /LENGTH=118 /DNA_ID=CAMNT_0019234651 /DNA_START=132 /DNA_END=488 /DNA_ORIENTATION=+